MPITQPQAMRSLASGLLLSLYDLSPIDDFDQLASLPSLEGRPMYEYNGQQHPMTYGPMGTLAIPGVVVEMGTATPYRGGFLCPVVASIGRNILDGSHERELEHLAAMAAKIRPLLFTDKTCPIYSFFPDQAGAEAIVSYLDWHDERLRTPLPKEETVVDLDGNSWLRLEITFTAFYRLET